MGPNDRQDPDRSQADSGSLPHVQPKSDKITCIHDTDRQAIDKPSEPLCQPLNISSSQLSGIISDQESALPLLARVPSASSSASKQMPRRRVRNPFKGYAGLSEDECFLPPYSPEPDFLDDYHQPDSLQSDVVTEDSPSSSKKRATKNLNTDVQSNSQAFKALLHSATKLEITKVDKIDLTDEEYVQCRDALRLNDQPTAVTMTPRKRFVPRAEPRQKYGCNRSALSCAVTIFESAVEVFDDSMIDKPQRSEAAEVQKSFIEQTMERVIVRASWDYDKQAVRKLICLVLFHLGEDFVRPEVSFEISGHADFIQDKCYDAAIEWLQVRAMLPAVLNEHEVACEKFLSDAFVRFAYGFSPSIDTKRELWDLMSILGLREYLYSPPAIRATFQHRIIQIYSTAEQALEHEIGGESISSTALVEKTLDLLKSQESHGPLSWRTVQKSLKKAALRTIHILLYRCEVVPPELRVAVDDITLATKCADVALKWERLRDGPRSPSPDVSDTTSSSATKCAGKAYSHPRSSALHSNLYIGLHNLLTGTQGNPSGLDHNVYTDATSSIADLQTTAAPVDGRSNDKCIETVVESRELSSSGRGVTGTLCAVEKAPFQANNHFLEDHSGLSDTRETETGFRYAIETHAIVDDPLPVIEDVPSIPLHWHFVHDPEDFWISEERQQSGQYFGISLESLRVRHWPRMSDQQKAEALQLRATTIEAFDSVKEAFQNLRVAVSGTDIAATIATRGSDKYPDRRDPVPIPFTQLCRRHLNTLAGQKKVEVRNLLRIADALENMNGDRQQKQLDHLKASGDYRATWKALRDAYIRDCATRGETVIGRRLDEDGEDEGSRAG